MIEIEEDGFAEVKIAGITQTIDLYMVYSRVYEMRKSCVTSSHNDSGDLDIDRQKFYGLLKTFIAELGYGEVSERVADRFAEAVSRQIEEFKKKDGLEE